MKHLGTKKLETERLVLRQFALEDADKMYQNWASDPEVTKYLTWPTHESVGVTKRVLSDWVSSYDNENQYQWCIAKKENNEPIGSISVVNMKEKAESFEIGYCISRAYWHQGITSEALRAVMDYLLNEVGARRIESRHDPRNPHSGAVMQKCGLRYEGTRIRADWNNTGICDEALYGYVKGVTEVQTVQGDVDERAKEQADGSRSAGQGKETTDGSPSAGWGNRTTDGEVAAQVQAADARTPKNVISDETIEYVGILAKLELSDEEKERAKKDMGEMLDYIDKLNELDTEGVEPMSHVFPVNNVFREDVVTHEDGSIDTLANAPVKKDGGFKVPKTIA